MASEGVVLIRTTNALDAIDPTIGRPGHFDLLPTAASRARAMIATHRARIDALAGICRASE